MTVDKIKIPIERWQFEEVLEKRMGEGIALSNLFIVGSSEAAVPNPGFYATEIETAYGKVKFFFVPECPKNKFLVLHKAKFDYPAKNSGSFTKDGDLIR